MNIYRHGDIDFIPVTDPKVKETIEHESFIVAEGEATGHHHRLTAALGAKVAVMKGFNNEMYIRISEPTPLSHEEHHTLTIQPGVYEIKNEREFDYFENAMRKVLD